MSRIYAPTLTAPLLAFIFATGAAGALTPERAAAQTRAGATGAAAVATFPVVEASIADLHRAMLAGQLTAEALVRSYLERIETFDRGGPRLNALILVNPKAIERARELDDALRRTGRLTGPLHGIPVIVKDNYDTGDLPTSAGSRSLAGSIPPDDAFQVRRIREAGAIVLAKSNMAEYAFSPYETIGSALPGYTFNPYRLNRVTAGSSGGTAAAVAASLGTVGLGTDTGNSIRGPASHQSLVGIRSTVGLTSRDGIVPLDLSRDIGGPLARTVEDAVRVFDVIAGTDPADTSTAQADRRRPQSYLAFLDPNGLRGLRVGVLRQQIDSTAHPEVVARFEEALATMREAGAIVVDPVRIPELDTIRGALSCRRFRYDLETYLATRGAAAPFRTLKELVDSAKVHPSILDRLRGSLPDTIPPERMEACRTAARNVEVLRAGVRKTMVDANVEVLVYPSWDNPPRLVGDLDSPHGNNSPQLSPPTGFPALTVPMGFVEVDLPVGLQILGDAWSEPTLIRAAYAFEQRTHHRRPPASTPELGGRR